MRNKKVKMLRRIARTQIENQTRESGKDLISTNYIPNRTITLAFCLKKLTKQLKTTYRKMKHDPNFKDMRF